MVAAKFDGNATLSLWDHRYFTKDCFIDAVTSCSDLFRFIASPLNWRFGGSTMVHPFSDIYIYMVVWNMFYFSIYWEFHHPNWLSLHHFSEGQGSTTNQPCRFVDGMDDRAAAAKAGMIGRFAEEAMKFPWIFAITWVFFASFQTKPGTQVCYFNLLKNI